MPRNARAAAARYSKAEGDEIAAMVLKLVRAVLDEAERQNERPPLEPIHASPVYRQYEAYVAAPGKAG